MGSSLPLELEGITLVIYSDLQRGVKYSPQFCEPTVLPELLHMLHLNFETDACQQTPCKKTLLNLEITLAIEICLISSSYFISLQFPGPGARYGFPCCIKRCCWSALGCPRETEGRWLDGLGEDP